MNSNRKSLLNHIMMIFNPAMSNEIPTISLEKSHYYIADYKSLSIYVYKKFQFQRGVNKHSIINDPQSINNIHSLYLHLERINNFTETHYSYTLVYEYNVRNNKATITFGYGDRLLYAPCIIIESSKELVDNFINSIKQ